MENFANLMKSTNPHIQEAQQTQSIKKQVEKYTNIHNKISLFCDIE